MKERTEQEIFTEKMGMNFPKELKDQFKNLEIPMNYQEDKQK